LLRRLTFDFNGRYFKAKDISTFTPSISLNYYLGQLNYYYSFFSNYWRVGVKVETHPEWADPMIMVGGEAAYGIRLGDDSPVLEIGLSITGNKRFTQAGLQSTIIMPW
jgi:hypothetical protein